MDKLDMFKPILNRLSSASDDVEMGIEIGRAIGIVNHP